MGTIVTIDVIASDRGDRGQGPGNDERQAAVARALEWFTTVEACCTRFDPVSELMSLGGPPPGTAVAVSEMLYHLVRFALAVAEDTGGAFDPTVGFRMEALGFNRHHHTGLIVQSGGDPDSAVSYRDVQIDDTARTITLRRRLSLDLGAVAKGFAIDMAVRELAVFTNFAIDAGGDMFLSGRNADDEPWSVGIRHPGIPDELIETIRVSGRAVCTSGDYERPSPIAPGAHHIISPGSGASARQSASVTVIASSAMLADALSTAAFVLGPESGIALLERHGVDGLIVSSGLECYSTKGFPIGPR